MLQHKSIDDQTVRRSAARLPAMRAGFCRRGSIGEFDYLDSHSRKLRSPKHLARIEALAIPPAWTDVWINADPQGHLQATGRDARGRKQYLYHERWIAEQDSTKFESLCDFGNKLPLIRRRVRRDLQRPQMDKRRVLAAVIQLIDRTFIRVGGERYRRENGSFGATTLRNRHVRKQGRLIFLDFNGKSGKRHRIELGDGPVASVVLRCLNVPGQLFSWKEGQEIRSISAANVNEYLQELAGPQVTSKDFRTWGGTVTAAACLAKAGRVDTAREMRKQMRAAVFAAARLLGNTPAVCRRSYIHPIVFSHFERQARPASPKRLRGLRRTEQAVLGMLAGERNRA